MAVPEFIAQEIAENLSAIHDVAGVCIVANNGNLLGIVPPLGIPRDELLLLVQTVTQAIYKDLELVRGGFVNFVQVRHNTGTIFMYMSSAGILAILASKPFDEKTLQLAAKEALENLARLTGADRSKPTRPDLTGKSFFAIW